MRIAGELLAPVLLYGCNTQYMHAWSLRSKPNVKGLRLHDHFLISLGSKGELHRVCDKDAIRYYTIADGTSKCVP